MQLLALGPFGPLELGVILVIVVLIFGVGRLPEVGGAVGKGIREFRKATKDDETAVGITATSVSDVTADVTPSNMHSTTTTSHDTVTTATPPMPNGATDSLFCGECGARNQRTSKFCAECGHGIGAPVR